MFTPARYLIYSEHMGGVPNDQDTTKMQESMNYFNLSHLSSKDPQKHQILNSNLALSSYLSSRQQILDGDHSPKFGGK